MRPSKPSGFRSRRCRVRGGASSKLVASPCSVTNAHTGFCQQRSVAMNRGSLIPPTGPQGLADALGPPHHRPMGGRDVRQAQRSPPQQHRRLHRALLCAQHRQRPGLQRGLQQAGQASASPVSCGDTITTDTKLHADLLNCPGDGIFIGADNITLDLNGHTIDGDGDSTTAGCGPQEDCDLGVASIDHDGVTVVHGPCTRVPNRRGGCWLRSATLDTTECWISPRQKTRTSGSGSLALPEAWSATARGATTDAPDGRRDGLVHLTSRAGP